jgi:Cu2+-exporting ATPase/Cu+-exporting ATPase
MNVMVLSYTDYFYPFEAGVASTVSYIMLVLTIPVMLFLGIPVLTNSARGISEFTLNMDSLIVVGAFSAYFLSVISILKSQGEVYFDTASMILVLVTLGRFLEANARAQASNAIKELLQLSPTEVTVIREGVEEKLNAEFVEQGDRVKVVPGESFAVDGEVIEGESGVDESMITGESKPAFKEKGSRVISGTLNIDGMLIYKATNVGRERILSRLVELIEEAKRSRSRVERFADRISAVFIPLVILIAALTFLFWGFKSGINVALMNSLSVLLISCPCALGIAAPMAIWVALGRAAKEGVLLRSGETVERLSNIKRIFFDKTGTLTNGKMELSSVFVDSNSTLSVWDFISISASLESASEHPLGKSLAEFACKKGHALIPTTEFRASPGMGVQGKVGHIGETIYIGSGRYMERTGLVLNEAMVKEKNRLESEGQTLVFCGWGREVRGILGFSEELREEAGEAVSSLRGLNIELIVLTGDNSCAGAALSKSLGVEVKSGLLPQEKVNEIRASKDGIGLTAMVGDGVNDAPALAASDVGIALGCGVDIARESADTSLLGNDLKKIPWVLRLAKRTRRRIEENLLWAFSYNTVGIGLAAMGLLKPVTAAILMLISSLFVMGNSLRIGNIKDKA